MTVGTTDVVRAARVRTDATYGSRSSTYDAGSRTSRTAARNELPMSCAHKLVISIDGYAEERNPGRWDATVLLDARDLSIKSSQMSDSYEGASIWKTAAV